MIFFRIVLFLIGLSFGSFLHSQTFIGVVLDKDTKEMIEHAQVDFVDLKTGTITDEKGVFKIERFSQKKIHIQITALGYYKIDGIITIDTSKIKTFYLEKDHFEIDEVVVSAQGGRLQRDNVISVTHKKLSELQQASPLTLIEAISSIPGVEQRSTGAGIGKPIIRGLSGNRIVTYAQGIRIENQQWGDEHGLGVGEVGIESVEVIKGPASLLYGADALGGVLYFIDEKYANQNTIEGFVQSKFLSNSLGSMNQAGFKIHKNKLKFNLFGSYSSHADYQVPSFSRVYNTRFDEKNIKSSIGFNARNWISNLRYSFLQNNFGIVEDATYSNSTKRNFALPYQLIDNHNLSFDNSLFIGDSKLNLILGYTNNYRKEFEEDTKNPALGLQLNTYTYNLKWYSPKFKKRFDFVIGSQGMTQDNKNTGEEILVPNAIVSDFGAFFIGNLNFSKLQLQAGIRGDYRQIDSKEMTINGSNFLRFKNSYNGVAFSGGAVYKTKKVKIRANISNGFRAPNTSELLSNGVQPGTNRFVIGNVGFTNENATQIDFSLDFQEEHFSFSINPFYNYIQNYIFLSPANVFVNNSPVFRYEQTSAFLYGGELGLHYHPHKIHWLHLESNLSTVFAEDKSGNALPLIPQTNLSSTIKTSFLQKSKARIKDVFVQHIYKFKQLNTGFYETSSVDYSLINVGVDVEIITKKNPIEISVGVKNVLNARYVDHLSRFKQLGISNQGINFYLGLKISLNKVLKSEQ